MANILVIDDESSIRRTLKEILEFEKHEVDLAADGLKALEMARDNTYDAILLDIKMPEMDGMEVLEKLQSISDAPVIMISGHGTIETAVEAIKAGAYDFIVKPPDLNRLLITVRNAIDKKELVSQTLQLRKVTNHKYEIVGDTERIISMRNMIKKVAPTTARVLITGENGSGKELVARQIHEQSSRAKSPFIEVNCAAIPAELIESQLFGHEKGSFTSAIKQRKGDFELAHGGTLFLDEIGDMSLSAQAKVLRALQENKIVRVGGEKEINVDVRIIAATNKDLRHEIEIESFREDLYHRLSVIIIEVPALRERKDDIPILVKRFIDDICASQGRQPIPIDENALLELQKYNWTGNVRELHNAVERMIILSTNHITKDDVNSYVKPLML
ncbi:MAG: sigma-54-dependent Fis family transcriptional regulator [Lentimicrobiaceae bacterium]|jgi:DNA-binding NtrC family response regulator|nr:sigma-54-dependent Fis family transcriptional regulator [Lentimicrobiaceae bacterium]MCP4911134.1 sigma-54-dependent Fis family transcriptional regulator [Bacteroidota bacterium]MBT4061363.1 sigma-54-dependent Fis family transcriptional regulator [Lentimicrobiaceae bacterium]MBT4190087.1 sigma-54-dependent Fis family transcriptional regulator [Lentimicrobiaceae bacterium]MBT4800813.1 sigma-54-dependent Fis family transcriptional regulator [Lentimicrobiaceae bacterium]